jgi:formylglycine-generating enzyme required for sulfatase activity
MIKKTTIFILVIYVIAFIASYGKNNEYSITYVIKQFWQLFPVAIFTIPAEAQTVSDFVLIKGTTFTMGSPDSELDRIKDEVVHRLQFPISILRSQKLLNWNTGIL